MSGDSTTTVDAPRPNDFEELSGEVELNAPEDFAQALIAYAAEIGANDVFITDEAAATSVKLRQLGRVREIRRLTRDYGRRLQNHYRTLSAIEALDSHRPSDGRTQFQLEGTRIIDLRVSSLPSLFGHDIAIRIAEQSANVASIDQLGMLPEENHKVHRLLDSPSGLVLVAGPTGSGKTHSLYAFLNYLNDGKRKIHTLEEPIERILPGIVQSQATNRGGLDFCSLLSAILRHSPDIIMIGEIRDEKTAEIAVKAAASGQLVLSTIHAQSSVGALDSLLAYGIHRRFLASTLTGIIGQRLVRRICRNCRREIQLPHRTYMLGEVRQSLGLHDPKLYQPVGCSQCHELGYDRLICIPEILIGTPEIKHAIAEGTSTNEIEQLAFRDGMQSLRDASKLRIALGDATPQDIYQVLPPMFD